MIPAGPTLLVGAESALASAVRIVGLGLLSALVAASAAVGYRFYARARIPGALAVLLGLGSIALGLNTLVTLSQYVDAVDEPFTVATALVNVVAFGVGALAAEMGRRIGDRFALRSSTITGTRPLNGDFSPFVSAVGWILPVTLPTRIDDIPGYDPVPDSTKNRLAGRTFNFPRGLRLSEVEARLVERLKGEFDVGHVDVELRSDGTVDYFAVGSRMAGLGSSLAPGTVAIAVRADPAQSASPGDAVQLWRTGSPPTNVAFGELRGIKDSIVTVAVDREDEPKIDRSHTYRLVTVPAEIRPDREFATMLRNADETMGVVNVHGESPLVGTPVGSLEAMVVAIRTVDGAVNVIPADSRVAAAGESIYAIGRPATLRSLEQLASPDEVELRERP